MSGDLTLGYRCAKPGVVTSARRDAAAHMQMWACILILFAGLLAWVLVEYLVIERITTYVRTVDPFIGVILRRRYTWVYHWWRLPLVGMATSGPLAAAGLYWFVARSLLRSFERSITVLALTFAIMHTLVATLLVLGAFLVAGSHLDDRRFDIMALPTTFLGVLAVAMVPGMLYVTMRLMDLLSERPKVTSETAPPERTAEDAAKALAEVACECEQENDEDEEGAPAPPFGGDFSHSAEGGGDITPRAASC